MSNDYRENTVAQMIEDDQFNADLNRNNQINPVFKGPYLSQPEYASKSTYAKFLFNRNEDANPYRQDSAADRQTAKLADAYANEHGISNAAHVGEKEIDQMDAKTKAELTPYDMNYGTDHPNEDESRIKIGKLNPKGFTRSQQYAQAYLKEQETGHQVYVFEAKEKQGQTAPTHAEKYRDAQVSRPKLDAQSMSTMQKPAILTPEQQLAQANAKNAALEKQLAALQAQQNTTAKPTVKAQPKADAGPDL